MTDQSDSGYCCKMRECFLIGLQLKLAEPPVEVADFMVCFDPPVISIKYCPFCGKPIDRNQKLRTRDGKLLG